MAEFFRELIWDSYRLEMSFAEVSVIHNYDRYRAKIIGELRHQNHITGMFVTASKV